MYVRRVKPGDWVTLVGVIVAAASAIRAYVSERRARAAQEVADRYQARAEQAEQRATKAAEEAAAAQRQSAASAQRAADAAERSASAAEARERRKSDDAEALELDPWELAPIPGDDNCHLINRTKTPKYGVTVSGAAIDEGPVRFPVIGPGKRVELEVLRFLSDDYTSVQVEWHRQQDLSDTPQSRVEIIPSRV